MRRQALTKLINNAKTAHDESLKFLGWLEELQKLKEFTAKNVIEITSSHYVNEQIYYREGIYNESIRIYFYPKTSMPFCDNEHSLAFKSNGIKIIVTAVTLQTISICIDFHRSLKEDVIAYAGINQLKLQ